MFAVAVVPPPCPRIDRPPRVIRRAHVVARRQCSSPACTGRRLRSGCRAPRLAPSAALPRARRRRLDRTHRDRRGARRAPLQRAADDADRHRSRSCLRLRSASRSRRSARRLALDLPVAALVGYQGFRVLVELLLHRAYTEGLMPVQMSYSGPQLRHRQRAITALAARRLAGHGPLVSAARVRLEYARRRAAARTFSSSRCSRRRRRCAFS